MADDSSTTIRATFKTREAADLAVEHLVQQHGISRPDIFIQSATDRNTAGSEPWTTTPEELAKFQAAETQKWGKVIRAAGIKQE